jgi:phage-related protein
MTTSNDPDQIRREIEATRAELSNDVNALSDKVSPDKIVERQKTKISGAARSVKESIMGTADSATSSAQGAVSAVGDKVSAVGDAVSDAPSAVKNKARGNPLAAGLIAFGAGMLVSSLFPATQKETQAAAALKEKAQPLVEEVTSVAKEAAGNLQAPAQEALESVKSTATDAVDTVKSEATTATDDVKGQALDAKDNVQQARS